MTACALSSATVYYFNGVTGESTWEKPTKTFPDVSSGPKSITDDKKKGGGGFLGSLFGGDKKKESSSGSSQQQQLLDLEKIATNNDDFLSELDDVIAEAEEAIKIAEELEKEPPKKGGLFSALGFGKKEATAESLIADVEERTSKIEKAVGGGEKKGMFASLRFGSDKPNEEKKEDVVVTLAPEPEENVWTEGLKNLFQKTFSSFSPPKLTTTPDKKKVVAVEEEKPKAASQSKAEVSDSDFLDVVWGAETSARPTLNIAEMMKSFQVQTKETTTVSDTAVVDRSKTLTLDMAQVVKPHPEKISWGGEDAVFTNGRSFGVFDGGSGAEKVSGKKLYSKSLADSMKKKSSAKSSWTVKEITDCMADAKASADVEGTGASTAVVASIGEDNVLRALNLGDSVCLVVRDGAIVARTREIIHYFDCPYQLGSDSPDRPKDGTTLQTDIYPGDIIIAGSDGVFDNLSDGDILDLVSSNTKAKSSVIAKKICDTSRTVSLDYDAVTPYSRAARGRSGYTAYQSGKGGKVDDISCVVVKAS